MSLTLTVGDLTIHRVIEQETTFLPAQELFPSLTADVLAENRSWMREAKAIDDTSTLILCFQSYIVKTPHHKTPHHTILVDSCIGNDKPRPARPKWNMKTDDTYMRGLKAAGVSVDDIDYVMCTHLHVDHVGWNTRLDNGRWVPTFPKARYVFAKGEYDYWTEQHAKADVPPFGDSVLPIVEARKAEIVSNDGLQWRPHAFAAADPLSRHVAEIRRRSGAGRGDPAQFPGALLRHRYAMLHRAFPLAVRGQDPPPGRRVLVRDGRRLAPQGLMVRDALLVIARSEATKQSRLSFLALDCFASLAMTA